MRAALAIVVVLASLALAGAASVRATGPSLGASIQSHLYADEDRILDVWNRSTVVALFTFTARGGWVIEPTSLLLAPDARGEVQVTQVGTDRMPLLVTVGAAEPPVEGTQRGEIALEAWLFTARPFDWLPWGIAAAFGVLLVISLGLYARRRRRV